MTETWQMAQLVLALIGLGVFSYLYALGGRGGTMGVTKAVRRYLGSAAISITCIIMAVWSDCFSWLMLLGWPCLAGALCLGYGSDRLSSRLLKRLVYGLAIGASAAPLLLPIGLWDTLLFNILLCSLVSVYAGCRNPMSAVGEEGYLGAVYALPVFFLIR